MVAAMPEKSGLTIFTFGSFFSDFRELYVQYSFPQDNEKTSYNQSILITLNDIETN
jgi:hypothetical protein